MGLTADSATAAPLNARVAGFLYAVVILGGTFAPFVVAQSSLSVDPAVISARMMQSPSAYRLGGLAEILVLTCDVALERQPFHDISRLGLTPTHCRLPSSDTCGSIGA